MVRTAAALRLPGPWSNVPEQTRTSPLCIVALGVSASGLVRTKTTVLLSVEETDKALAKKIDYTPPGR